MMAGNADTLIQVFTRAPVPGYCKTRLASFYGKQRAARWARKLALSTVQTLQTSDAPLQLWCAPDSRHEFFLRLRRKFSLSLHRQHGCGLGARMAFALQQGLQCSNKVILVGTDCPTLSLSYIDQAGAALAGGAELVLGPANDGGYVLIAVSKVDRHLFNGIVWGTDKVLASTLRQARRLGLKTCLLEPLQDIDTVHDIRRSNGLQTLLRVI